MENPTPRRRIAPPRAPFSRRFARWRPARRIHSARPPRYARWLLSPRPRTAAVRAAEIRPRRVRLRFRSSARAGPSRTLALARHLWSSSPKSGVITAARFLVSRAALERAGSSRQPEVVIGAAAACAAAARADPRRATELALPIRECLDASAPAPARALAMEAIASMCEADALDFYLAFKVVAKRAPAAPDDPLVASRWAALLAHGAADADARPDAAAAVVAAAWDVARAGVTPLVERARAKRWEATRAAAYRSLARYDASILVESPASDADADGASTDGPVPAADLATAYLREPSFGVGSAAEAAAEATYNVARRERDAMARARLSRRRRVGDVAAPARTTTTRFAPSPPSPPPIRSYIASSRRFRVGCEPCRASPAGRMCAARRHSGLGPRGRARTFTLPAARGGGRRRRDERPATRLGTPRASSSTRRRAPSCVSRVRFRSVHGVAAPRMVVAREPLVAIVVAIRAAVGGRGTRRARGRRGSGGAWRGSRRGARERRGRSPRRAEGRTHPGRRAVRRVSARLARRTTRLSRRGGVRRRRRIIRRVRIHRLLLRVHRRVRDGRHRIDVRAGRFRRRGARSVFGARRRRGGVPRGRSRTTSGGDGDARVARVLARRDRRRGGGRGGGGSGSPRAKSRNRRRGRRARRGGVARGDAPRRGVAFRPTSSRRRGGGTRVRGVLRRRGGDWRDVRGDGLGRGAFGERRWTPARRRRRRAPRRVCP